MVSDIFFLVIFLELFIEMVLQRFSCYFLYHISDRFCFCSRSESVDVAFSAIFFFCSELLKLQKIKGCSCLLDSLRVSHLSLMVHLHLSLNLLDVLILNVKDCISRLYK